MSIISAIDKALNIEQLTPTANVKIGGKTEVKIANVQINQVFSGSVSSDNPDLVAEKVHQLSENPPKEDENSEQDAFLVLSPYMGIVKSPELPGTRVHLEFTVTNKLNRPIVLKGALLKFNGGELNFKKFFKVKEDAGREPDFTTRFPIIISSNGATRLNVEFENLEKALIEEGSLKGELHILIDRNRIATQDFIFDVNKAMKNTLIIMEQQALATNAPVVFDAMIQS